MAKAGKDFIGVGCGAIVINDQKQILLVKRSENSSNEPGLWSRPGGKVEFNEKIETAIRREVKEETGIDVEVIEFLELTQVIDNENNSHWIALGYLAKYISGEAKNLEPDKHDDVKWFSIDEIPQNITSYTKNAISRYLKIKNSNG